MNRKVTLPRLPMKAWAFIYVIALILAGSSFFSQINVQAATAPSFIASATAIGKVTAMVVAVPTGTTTDDVMVAHIVSVGTSHATPTGWTQIGTDVLTAGSEIRSSIYYKVATASEPASYSWTLSGSVRTTGAILTYRGADPGTPINQSAAQANASSNTPATPAITQPTLDNTMLVAFFSIAVNAVFTPPSGMTEQVDIQSGANSVTSSVADVELVTAASVSKTASTDATDLSLGHLIAIAPGASADTPINATSTTTLGSTALLGLGLPRASTVTLASTAVLGFPRASAAAFADAFGFAIGINAPGPDNATAFVSTARLEATYPRSSEALLVSTANLGFPRTSSVTFGDARGLAVGINQDSAPVLGSTSQSDIGFARASSATLTQFAGFGLPRASAATLNDAFGLGFPRASAATVGSTAQVASSFGRASVTTLTTPFGLGLPRTDSTSLFSTAQLGIGIPRSSADTLTSTAQNAVFFGRASAANLEDVVDLGFARSSTAILADSFGLGFPRASTPSLIDTAQKSIGFTRASAAQLGDAFKTGFGLPRSSETSLGDTSAVARGVVRADSSAPSFDSQSQSAVGLIRSSASTLGSVGALTAAFLRPDTSTATLSEIFGLGLPRTSAVAFDDVSTLLLAMFRPDTSTLGLNEVSQVAVAIGRASATTLGDTSTLSQGQGFASASQQVFGDTALLNQGVGFPNQFSTTILGSTGTAIRGAVRPDSSAVGLGSTFQNSVAFIRTSGPTLGSTSFLTQGSAQTFASEGTFGSTGQEGIAFFRGSLPKFSDVSLLVQGLGRAETSTATLAELVQLGISLPRSSAASLGVTSTLSRSATLPGSTTAVLGDPSQLASVFLRRSSSTFDDVSSLQRAASLGEASTGTLAQVSQIAVGLPRSSATALGVTSSLARAVTLPGSTAVGLGSSSQIAAAFFRTSSASMTISEVIELVKLGNILDTSTVTFGELSQSAIGIRRSSTASLGVTSTLNRAANLPNATAATFASTSQSATAFLRSSTAALGVTSVLARTASFPGASAAGLASTAQSATSFLRPSAATLGDISSLSRGANLPGASGPTLGSTSQLTAALSRASAISMTISEVVVLTKAGALSPDSEVTLSGLSQAAISLLRNSGFTMGDNGTLARVVTLPDSITATLASSSQSAVALLRNSPVSLGDTSSLARAATLTETSAASLGDISQIAAAFNRSSSVSMTISEVILLLKSGALTAASSATLADSSQSGVGAFRSSVVALGDSSLLARAATTPGSSSTTLEDTAQAAVAFLRSTGTTLTDTSSLNRSATTSGAVETTLADISQNAIAFPRGSAAALGDISLLNRGVTLPRSSSAVFGDSLQSALASLRDSAASFGDASLLNRAATISEGSAATFAEISQSTLSFPRGSGATLGDVSLLSRGVTRSLSSAAGLESSTQSAVAFLRNTTGVLSDIALLQSGLKRAHASAFAMSSTSQNAVTFPRNSVSGLLDVFGLGFGNSSGAALAESVVLSVQRNFVQPTPVATVAPTPIAPTLVPTQEPTTVPPLVNGGGAVNGGAPISSIPSGSLTADILNDGVLAGANLESVAILDPATAGASLAQAASFDPIAAAEALIATSIINSDISAVIFTEAALFNTETVANTLVEAAKSELELTANLLVESGKINALASGQVWASAGAVDSLITGDLLVEASKINAEVTGQILVSAVETNIVTMRNTLIQAARLDALFTGAALVEASKVDPLAMSKAILSAAKVDPGVMQATLESGSLATFGGLEALGNEIPVEIFISENAPVVGVEPTTGEVWETVAPTSAPVTVFAKFRRANPEAAVEVIEIPVLPATVPPLPEGEIPSSFVEITAETFDQEELRATHVTFSVSKAWLVENNIHPWAVTFSRYDEFTNDWNPFSTKRAREDEEFIYYTTTPPGFSLWAISGRTDVKEIEFRVRNLKINPPQIREFEEVVVSANVANLGDEQMNHNATLWINGRVQATQTVQIAPNSQMPVSFSLFPREGAYEVRIDRQVGHLIVGQAPPPPSSSTVLVLGNASTTRTVTVANPAEGAPLEYEITTDQPWLTANPFTFNLRPGTFQPVTLTVNRNGLEPGSYSGQAVISFRGLISGFSLVTVSMDVSESAVDPVVSPTLNLGPGGISGTTIVSNPLSDSALLYTITSHVPWLNVASGSFVLAAGASQAIILTADRSALDIGFHTGLVTISYSGAISGSSVVAVELEIPPPPPPPLIPPVVNARLDLGATGTGGIITVSTPPSGGPLEYTVTSNEPWLTASPSKFTLSAGESRPVTLSVDRSGLEFGRYAAEITIAFDGSTTGSSLVPVTIEMAGSAFPSEGRGLDTWALILIAIGGAALLWIIVSQASYRLSGTGRRGGATSLGGGGQLDFGAEPAQGQPSGSTLPALQASVTESARSGYSTLSAAVGALRRAAQDLLKFRPETTIEPVDQVESVEHVEPRRRRASQRPAVEQPDVEPTQRTMDLRRSAAERPEAEVRIQQPMTGASETRHPRIPFAEKRNALIRLVSEITTFVASLVRSSGSVVETAGNVASRTSKAGRGIFQILNPISLWAGVVLLIGNISDEIGKRIDIGIAAYVVSVPILTVMVLTLILKIFGVGIGLDWLTLALIAITAGIVLLITHNRRTRSGNIRRAERAARALDENRA